METYPMETYNLYQRYVARFGHTFAEELISDRAWKAAQILMTRALEEGGEPVTDADIRACMNELNSSNQYL